MTKVRLETKEGELVGTFEIPPFVEAPHVALWGSRTFLCKGFPTNAPASGYDALYREVFAVTIVTTSEEQQAKNQAEWDEPANTAISTMPPVVGKD